MPDGGADGDGAIEVAVKSESVIGCVSCGKPALLVGDETPRQFPACFWCLAERRPGAFGLFIRERMPSVFDVDVALRCLGAFTFGLRAIYFGRFHRRDFEDADLVETESHK